MTTTGEKGRAELRLPEAALREAVRRICAQAGCDPEEAASIAGHLVESNLMGHDSHGVRLVPEYVSAMRSGRIRLGRRASPVLDRDAILVLDGGMGVGQLIARDAMDRAVLRARRFGAAVLALRNVHHLGRIGAWAEQCAAQGCASVHFVNVVGHRPYVAPFGGIEGRLATNPFCAGLPAAAGPPIVLDMATSRIAHGKVAVARNRGERVPEGCLIDANGQATTDPGVMFADPKGALLPFGEHKGYGLALICELFAGVLAGGGTNQPATPITDTITNAMLSIVIDVAGLGVSASYGPEIAALCAWVKSATPRPGTAAILVPGEPERIALADRRRDGIPLDPRTLQEMLDAAAEVGCDLSDLPLFGERPTHAGA